MYRLILKSDRSLRTFRDGGIVLNVDQPYKCWWGVSGIFYSPVNIKNESPSVSHSSLLKHNVVLQVPCVISVSEHIWKRKHTWACYEAVPVLAQTSTTQLSVYGKMCVYLIYRFCSTALSCRQHHHNLERNLKFHFPYPNKMLILTVCICGKGSAA